MNWIGEGWVLDVDLITMKMIARYLLIATIILIASCAEQEPRGTDYSIYQISVSRPTIGNISVTDLDNGKMSIEIQLNPFSKGSYPTHLHFGGINTVGELALQLNDLDGETGRSKTVLNNVELSDGSMLTYERLLEMDGSIKVHNAANNLKNAVVAYGNIGKNDNYLTSGITVCIGH